MRPRPSGGSATVNCVVTHRGPTLGYRITDGETTLCYIPDHEPALGAPLTQVERMDLGFDLAAGADLLIHDCQYTDDEYPEHVGWGTRRSPTRSPSPIASARGARCSSITTRCTPMRRSTRSRPAPRAPGANWAIPATRSPSREAPRSSSPAADRLSKRVPALRQRPVQTCPPKFRRADKEVNLPRLPWPRLNNRDGRDFRRQGGIAR